MPIARWIEFSVHISETLTLKEEERRMDDGKQRQRTLSYWRVAWLKGRDDNLAKHLKDAHDTLTTTRERAFRYAEGEVQGLYFESERGNLFFHVVYCIPKQSASTIPVPSGERSKDTGLYPPPDQHNYMEGDIFFLVRDNHIILCPSIKARGTVALFYIKEILRQANKESLLDEYSVRAAADINKVKLLHQEGIKDICLNVSLYEASAKYINRKATKITSSTGRLGRFFSILLGKDTDDEFPDIMEKENLTVSIKVSFDSRKKGGEVEHEHLKKAAQYIVDDDENEGFTITTGNKNKITADQIRLSKKVNVTPNGQSLFRVEIKERLEEYLIELKNSGMLEQ